MNALKFNHNECIRQKIIITMCGGETFSDCVFLATQAISGTVMELSLVPFIFESGFNLNH